MLVMFLPLKIFLLISGTSQVGMFKEIEEQLGTNAYIALILFVTSLLYILNLVIQIYYSRAFNLEKLKLQGTKDFDGMSIKFIRKLYTPYIDVLSSLVMLCISFLVFMSLSYEYAFLFFLGFVIYYFIVQYFLFTDSKYKLKEKMKVTIPQALNIFSGVFFLFTFFLVFFVFMKFDLPVMSALLLLLLSRLTNNSIKAMFSSLSKIKVLNSNRMP
ncbi:hypothetical protein AB4371_13025 [Vibrio sp. 10N.261.51.A3]|uniref:hypothetical protein n=1 Tax=Vibrio sp. 10N.261.51.A3 TaxID=3229673 RepID=UPI003551B169